MEFNERSGMASSTRRRAIELWQTDIPAGAPAKLAKVLFSYENPPGTTEFSGSQDAIGIVFPGLNRLDYAGDYWPEKVRSVHDPETLTWLEKHLRLVPLGPRGRDFHALKGKRVSAARARALATAADGCWRTIQKRNAVDFGRFCRESFEAQLSMFPGMSNAGVEAAIGQYANRALGWKLSGAGGGGYLVLVTSEEIPGAIKIRIRRQEL
jgi:galactokinase/mevalonate kinase-like predicted kinase